MNLLMQRVQVEASLYSSDFVVCHSRSHADGGVDLSELLDERWKAIHYQNNRGRDFFRRPAYYPVM